MSSSSSKHCSIVRSHNEIIKSASDARLYRVLELRNKMKIMLISDPSTDKAAAAMNVNIGSFSDPEELPGLAHFCEHMLFLGTAKYPDEAEYLKFINEHAGYRNAYTSFEHTNYYFDIGYEHLRDILDRFAQFFVSPLFDESCTDREVNAVDSENQKNIMTDFRRIFQVDKATCDPNHRFARFLTGNKQTLDTIPKRNNISVRNELLQFYKNHYSANVMALVVLGKENLDELQLMTVELFGTIRNTNVERYSFQSPFRPQDLQKIIRIPPVKDMRTLFMRFPIFDCTELYKSSPAVYLSHLIGHRGPGSLLSELKRLGWVNMLGVSKGANCMRGSQVFVIRMDLTEEGLQHISDIINLAFEYIAMLNKEGVQEWIFDEMKERNAIKFRFKDKKKPINYVSGLAEFLHYYPPEDVLSAYFLLGDFKPDLIRSVLKELVPSNMRVFCVSKSFEDTADQTEKWFGTKYSIEDLPKQDIKRWTEAGLNPAFSLPLKNEFIPKDFEISPLSEKHSTIPTLVKSEKLSKVWFKQDDQFKLPKACVVFELFSPIANVDPQSANKVYMFAELFKDAFHEYVYPAELAGLGYGFTSTTYGIQFDVKGYNDKQKVLVEKIFKKMATFKVDQKRFEVIKESYLRVLKNFEADQPYAQAMFYTHAIKCERAWLKSDLLAALPQLTCEELQEFIKEFMSRLHLQMLVHGNFTCSDALKIAELVENILKQDANVTSLVQSQLKRHREVCLPKGSSYVYQYHNQVRDICGMDLFLQVGLQNNRDNVLVMLMAQIMKEPCFNVLRTKETLGYIVGSTASASNGVHGLRVFIQSERPPDYLEQRAEAFINHIETVLEELETSVFNDHVTALVTRISEKPKELITETFQHWNEIGTEQLQFRRAEIQSKCLKNIRKEEVQKFYKEYIHIDGPKRAKLVVHVLAKNLKECNTTPEIQMQENSNFYPCPLLKKSTVIKDIELFRRNLPLYPRVGPLIDDVED